MCKKLWGPLSVGEGLGVLVYSLILTSPAVMFYITKGYFNLFTPVFVGFQIILLALFLQILKKKSLIVVFTLPLLLFTIFQWVHFLMFGSQLSGGAIAAILATNSEESGAFISIIPIEAQLIILAMTSVAAFSLLQFPQNFQLSKKINITLVCFALLVILFRGHKHRDLTLGFTDSLATAHPFYSVTVFVKAVQLLNDYRDRLKAADQIDVPVDLLAAMENDLHLLIIGESARKHNWSLYGYARSTNEFLAPLANELTLFSDLVSAANSTIPSLYHALSFGDETRLTTLMDLAQKIGLKVYWVSNQQQFGVYDNPTAVLAQRSDQTYFIKGLNGYDEELLPKISQLMQESRDPTLIIVHLMGSHGYYHLRYPKEFNHFDNCTDTEELKILGSLCKTMNQYDNTIRYTDWLVAQLIKDLKKTGRPVTLTYFSDHGENIHTGDGVIGHGGTVISKKEMEVPMFVWMDTLYQEKRPQLTSQLLAVKDKPISLFDFLPSYLFILGGQADLSPKINILTTSSPGKRKLFGPNGNSHFYEDL